MRILAWVTSELDTHGRECALGDASITVSSTRRERWGLRAVTTLVPTIFMINLKQMPAQASVSSQG